MPFGNVKTKLTQTLGKVVLMPRRSLPWRFAKAFGADDAQADETERKWRAEPEPVRLRALQRMRNFFEAEGAIHEAARAAAAHAKAERDAASVDEAFDHSEEGDDA